MNRKRAQSMSDSGGSYEFPPWEERVKTRRE